MSENRDDFIQSDDENQGGFLPIDYTQLTSFGLDTADELISKASECLTVHLEGSDRRKITEREVLYEHPVLTAAFMLTACLDKANMERSEYQEHYAKKLNETIDRVAIALESIAASLANAEGGKDGQ